MKALPLAACLFAAFAVLAFAEPAFDAATPAPPASTELAELQKEFARRRAEALRPVASWYRARLEALQQRVSNETPAVTSAVANALAAARETFWQDDQPELSQALVGTPWLWRSVDDNEGVPTTFRADGTVEHIGLRGQWRITGPCEVTIRSDGREIVVLRFNATLSAYEGDRSKVSGHRLAPVPSAR